MHDADQRINQMLKAQLQPIKDELTGFRRAAATMESLGSVYQAFRLAFFKGKAEPLGFPNIDYFIITALINDIKFVRYDAGGKRMILSKDGVLFATDAYFYIMFELFAKNEYRELARFADRPFVVYDVGMNRGYASLWFAGKPQCRAVYGFEILDAPYQWALYNFSLNPTLAGKLKPFGFGLAGENKTAELLYEEASDGVSTIMPAFYDSYWAPQRKAQALKKTVQLRKASEVFSSLPKCAPGELRVLKIDVEGAEYEILEDLGREKQLDFDIILAEAHLGLDKLLALTPGYTPVEVVKHSDLMANVTLVRTR
jgi:FkbM family methyltransferase